MLAIILWKGFETSDTCAELHSLVQGNCIHAQIYPPDHDQFKTLIKEGNVYNLSYFRVRKSGKYRPVDSDHMINFTKWTSVEEVVEIPPAFPMYTYSLTPMEQLPPRAEDTTYFTGISIYVHRLWS
jgi:replication factor A1